MATNLQFIKKVTSSDIVSVSYTDLFNTNYDVFELFIDLQYNAVSYLDIYLLDSGGSVLTGSHYSVAVQEMRQQSSFAEYKYQNSTIWRGLGGYLGNVDAGYGMKMTVFNPTSTSKYTFALSQSVSPESAGFQGTKGMAVYKATDGVYGLKINASGGGSTTFDFLNVSVYGVK
tara:strand:- start:573 stop:1091 length:519 start_codon:yes stop_codon:yes gene_type:complete